MENNINTMKLNPNYDTRIRKTINTKKLTNPIATEL